jgi:hypothetical protein
MYLFSTMEVQRHELEDIGLSSATDSDIVVSNMSWARRVAKYIIEDGRIYEDGDISMPFTLPDFNKRVNEVSQELGLRGVHGQRVLAELRESGILEPYTEKGKNYLRFKFKIGTLTDLFGSHISANMEPRFQFTEDDRGANDTTLSSPKPWKGLNRAIFGKL